MSRKITQKDLLVQHEQVFRLIVLVGNQIIRQSQLTEILLKTNYCKNAVAVTRLLQRLEEFDLIKRGKEEATNFKFVQATKTAVKFIEGPNAIAVKITRVTRETMNAVKVEIFKHYFLKDNMGLEEVLNLATQESVCTLFNSKDRFYDKLSANSLAFHSFNSKSSNFFLQKRQMEYIKEQQRLSIDRNMDRGDLSEEEKKKNKIRREDRKCWTLETLEKRQIYLIDWNLKEPSQRVKAEWLDRHLKDVEDFEAKTLHLKFALITISDEPNKRNLVKNLMSIYSYVHRTFKMHEAYFIRNNKIKRAIVDVDVEIQIILLNDRAANYLDLDDLEDWFKKKIRLRLRRKNVLESYKHHFYINCLSMGVNPNNEHLQ